MQTPNALLCSILFITFVTLVFGYKEVTFRVSGAFITVCTLKRRTVLPSRNIQFKEKKRKRGEINWALRCPSHPKEVFGERRKYMWPTKGFPVMADHQAPVRSIWASIPFLPRSGWVPWIPSQHLKLFIFRLAKYEGSWFLDVFTSDILKMVLLLAVLELSSTLPKVSRSVISDTNLKTFTAVGFLF